MLKVGIHKAIMMDKKMGVNRVSASEDLGTLLEERHSAADTQAKINMLSPEFPEHIVSKAVL